ncbi:MAG TPA: hypothetical protein VG986_20890 [Pseudolabrys sp.]|nr:hypothetical protein [Pseudolabrys sp.]
MQSVSMKSGRNSVRRMAAAALLTTVTMPVIVAQGVAQPSYAMSPAVTSGQCNPTAIRYVNEYSGRATSATTFVNIPGTTFKFTQGGTSPSCVIVEFSATAITSANAQMTVRPLLDSAASALPASVPFIVDKANYEVRTASFIFPNVSPGSHTITMQFETSVVGGGSAVEVYSTNVIVHHAP